jgi:hypothetical protein
MENGFGAYLRASRDPFANLMRIYPSAKDGETDFDWEPVIAKIPQFVSPSKQDADSGNTGSTPKGHDFDSLYSETEFPEVNKTATSKHAQTAAEIPIREWARLPAGLPAHVQLHGVLTTSSPEASNFEEAPKSVRLLSRRSRPRNNHQVLKEVEDGVEHELSNPSAFSAHVVSTQGDDLPKPLVLVKKQSASLEKNKIAAAECRIKRKRTERKLQKRSHELASKNRALRKIVLDLSQEAMQLQSILSIHLLEECWPTPMNTGEELGIEAFDGRFFLIDLSNDDHGFEETTSLHQQSP